MPKSRDAFRTISEVAEWLDTPAHVLRFWESKFSQVKPVKRAGGRRYYRPADMELLGGIKRLLHDDGMTIKGVQKVLREQGVRHVAALASQPVDEDEAIDDGTLIEDAPYAEVPLDEVTDSVVAFPGEHLQQPASGMAPSEAEPQEAPESPLDEQDSMPVVAHDVADEPAQQEADEIQTAAADTPPAEDTTDEDTEAAAAAPMEPGDSPIETTDAEDATVEEVAPATDEIEDATMAPQASEETPDTLTATSTDTAPTLDLWGDNDTPELPFDLAPPSWKPPLPDDLVAALHPDTAEVLESLDPEPTDTFPAETAVTPAGLDLPDFGADPEAQPVPSAPAPAIGPLGQLARIRSLT
ncbi:MAG: MerR family transcriptional regulator, partial [Mameliella sp.]|nr:MerR family transcriptional regulator [Mameliella sp.]